MRLLLLGLLIVATTACAPRMGPSKDPFGVVPDDFSVDLTILVAPDGDRAHERTSRLVVLADGSLHYDARPGRGPNTMPGWVRQLDRTDMGRLWDAAERNGLDDATYADETADLRRGRMPSKGSVWLLAITAGGQRWNYLRAYAPGEDVEPSIKRFARAALTMAWAADTPDDAVVVDPVRWYFGEDPWGNWDAAVEARGRLEVQDEDS